MQKLNLIKEILSVSIEARLLIVNTVMIKNLNMKIKWFFFFV
jgi:hypothetical protein